VRFLERAIACLGMRLFVEGAIILGNAIVFVRVRNAISLEIRYAVRFLERAIAVEKCDRLWKVRSFFENLLHDNR
jgi:hypothetical protein